MILRVPTARAKLARCPDPPQDQRDPLTAPTLPLAGAVLIPRLLSPPQPRGRKAALTLAEQGVEDGGIVHQNVPSSILNAAGAFGFLTLIQLLTRPEV
jgi:hypothetical protein